MFKIMVRMEMTSLALFVIQFVFLSVVWDFNHLFTEHWLERMFLHTFSRQHSFSKINYTKLNYNFFVTHQRHRGGQECLLNQDRFSKQSFCNSENKLNLTCGC